MADTGIRPPKGWRPARRARVLSIACGVLGASAIIQASAAFVADYRGFHDSRPVALGHTLGTPAQGRLLLWIAAGLLLASSALTLRRYVAPKRSTARYRLLRALGTACALFGPGIGAQTYFDTYPGQFTAGAYPHPSFGYFAAWSAAGLIAGAAILLASARIYRGSMHISHAETGPVSLHWTAFPYRRFGMHVAAVRIRPKAPGAHAATSAPGQHTAASTGTEQKP